MMRCSALQAARVRVQVNNTAAIREATQTATSIASNWVAYAVAQARARLQPTSRAAERETSNDLNFLVTLRLAQGDKKRPLISAVFSKIRVATRLLLLSP